MYYVIVGASAVVAGFAAGLLLRNYVLAFMFKEYNKVAAELHNLRKSAASKVVGK